jgi:hypothetical protein
VSGVVTVETTSQWHTSSLLRKLTDCGAYAIQVDHGHWLVRGSLARRTVEDYERLVGEWAREEGAPLPGLIVGDGLSGVLS